MKRTVLALNAIAVLFFTLISCNNDSEKTFVDEKPLVKKELSELEKIVAEWQTGLRASKVERPVLPIERFAVYNVAPDGKSFATSHDEEDSGLFTIEEAEKIAIKDKDGVEYVLPAVEDWYGITSPSSDLTYGLMGEEKRNVEEKLALDGTEKWYQEDRYSSGNGVLYVLRYKKHKKSGINPEDGVAYAENNDMLTAYKYERVPTKRLNEYYLKITARYLGPSFKWGIEVVTNEGFWHSYTKEDIVMILPAAGEAVERINFDIACRGTMGMYWDKPVKDKDETLYWITGFGRSWLTQSTEYAKEDKRAVRLIRK